MNWFSKLMILLGILVLIAAILGMVYLVSAKNIMNEYIVQSSAAFNAAMFLNANETFTDPEYAVIASFGGKSAVVIPENYKSVLYFLQSNAVSPLFAPLRREEAMTVSLCGEAFFTIAFDADGEKATVELDNGTKTFRMRIRGSALRDRLLKAALEGTGAGKNIPLP